MAGSGSRSLGRANPEIAGVPMGPNAVRFHCLPGAEQGNSSHQVEGDRGARQLDRDRIGVILLAPHPGAAVRGHLVGREHDGNEGGNGAETVVDHDRVVDRVARADPT